MAMVSATVRRDMMAARLHGLLQASRRVACRPSRKGRLDPRRVHAVAVGEARVFLAAGKRPAVNTAVHILLDSSASMRERMALTSRCCAALAQALSRTGISVGITAFPGEPIGAKGPTVVPILRHGEAVHANVGVPPGGQTPLAEALWWVLQRLAARTEERRIVLILTDGAPDDSTAATAAITAGQGLGVEICLFDVGSGNGALPA
ncbi:MAG: VWA domain-containing protein [Magnetospirillum sp.]|nr:VWA domain-containing protein [Magnetospirillum sp.]